jgi:hypothetical protein
MSAGSLADDCRVSCYMLHVTCHMSHVTCHMSHVTVRVQNITWRLEVSTKQEQKLAFFRPRTFKVPNVSRESTYLYAAVKRAGGID